MEDNFTLDRLLRTTVIASAFTMPIISILLMTGLKTENKVLLTIGTVIITMLGVAFLISDIVIIIAMLFLALACAIWIQKQIIKVIIWFLKNEE